jgi:hypothetical protein
VQSLIRADDSETTIPLVLLVMMQSMIRGEDPLQVKALEALRIVNP